MAYLQYYLFYFYIHLQKREFYIAAAGGAAYHNLSHIQQSIQDLIKMSKQNGSNEFKDIQLKDCTRDYGMLSLQGPKSKEILQCLTSEKLDNVAFPFSTNKWIEVAGHKVRRYI